MTTIRGHSSTSSAYSSHGPISHSSSATGTAVSPVYPGAAFTTVPFVLQWVGLAIAAFMAVHF